VLSHRLAIVIIALGITLGGLGLTLFLVGSPFYPKICALQQAANANQSTDQSCVYFPGQSYYYNGILQLYAFNQTGHRWGLELNPEQLPYNSGTTVVPTSQGWWVNQGPDQARIRNEVSTPNFAHNRPNLGTGPPPYDQGLWRKLGYMDKPDDYKNIEASGLYYIPPYCSKAAGTCGPMAVDMVMRGGVQQSGTPYNCQAPSYHVAFAWSGDDQGARLERDIDHAGGPTGGPRGYCKPCINGKELSGGAGIPTIEPGQPFGLKTVLYNNAENTKVHIDVYLDTTGVGNHWQLLWSYIDQGGDPRIDSVRAPSQCAGADPNLPVTWGGPVGTSFRINAQGVQFRQLTVQEMQPPIWH